MPNFSKRHYEAVADALRDVFLADKTLSSDSRDSILTGFDKLFSKDSKLFDFEKFQDRVFGF